MAPNDAWLSRSSSLARLRFPWSAASRADLSAVAAAPASTRPETAARLGGGHVRRPGSPEHALA